MAIALVTGGIVSVGGSLYLISHYDDTARDLEYEAGVVADLRAGIVAQTISMSNARGELAQIRAAAAATNTKIEADFVRTEGFSSAASVEALRGAHETWQSIVAGAVAATPGVSPAERTVSLGAVLSLEAPKALALLDRAAVESRASARSDLARYGKYTDAVIGVLALVVIAGLAMLGRLARRLNQEVLTPVDHLRTAADRLAVGDLTHRATVHANDELGALAASFNAMADALHENHQVLEVQAHRDALTGLANRPALKGRISEVLARPSEAELADAVLFLDLDDFKNVNDTLGHAAGDELLSMVATRLGNAIRPQDLLARLGGDEFAVLLTGIADSAAAREVANAAVLALGEPFAIGHHNVCVGASIGVAMRLADSSVESLMKQADVAMYSAKARGKNRVEVYDPGLERDEVELRAFRADASAAVERDELVLQYQPMIDLETGELLAVEALVRWQHASKGLLPPSAFIGIAEQSGSIAQFGEWVLRTAAEQVLAWQQMYASPDLGLSVNVSIRELIRPSYVATVRACLDRSQLSPGCLTLEFAESALVGDMPGVAEALAELRSLGVTIAIDGFGSGYTSVGYVKSLPVDVLKLSPSVVSGSEEGARLLPALVRMGQELGLEVIPVGLETAEELDLVRRLGCHIGQGFLLGHPSPASDINARLQQPRPLPVARVLMSSVPPPRG